MNKTCILSALLLAGCGEGIQNPLADYPLPDPNESPGGIWTGTRATGTEIVVLITEDGEFRMLDPLGNVGFGRMNVQNSNSISLSYKIAPPFQQTIFDGSKGATCTATGTVSERLSLDIETECVSDDGLAFGNPLQLSFSALSARPAGLATIAGNYGDLGDVLSIDGNGEMFQQGTQTGCIINGEVSVVDTQWNLYRASIAIDNCANEFESLSGTTWEGVMSLIDDAGTDLILGGFHTETDSERVGLVIALPRL